MNISSLLCDDDGPSPSPPRRPSPRRPSPPPVILAPHLRGHHYTQRSPDLPRSRPPSHSPTSYSPPSPFYPRPSSSSSSSTPFTYPPVQVQPRPAYMGLEALVHAATQEQRRLSESTSPVASYPPPSPQRLTMGTSDPPNRAIVPVDVQRPIKKQRLSDPSAAAEERERNFAAHYGVLPRRLSGPGAHAYPVNDNAILGIGGPAECSRAEEEKRRTSLESTGKNSTSDTKELPEQDAHEWLLEHYAGPTPSPSIPPPKHPMARIRAGRPASVQKDRTPAPEIASELEKELEEAAASKPVDDNFDPDVALELVAGSLEEERVSMEVDDELLSLVDDPAPPLQRYPYAAPPPSLRLSKPLTPTIVTVSPSFVVSPAPVSPFQPNPERGSMPPPATITKSAKGAAKGKKSAVARSGAKPKQAAKPRAKAGTKAVKPDTTSPAPVPASSSSRGSKASPMTASAIKKSSATATVPSRSRSTSTMTGLPDADNKADVEKDEVEDNEQEQKEDDKLYCVCKTRYDEDRVMIACDRCDEWYHTQCVDMPDLEVDLVDQFVCPPCIESKPQLNLRTTYKTRCFRGLNHANPSSPEACHKAARGDYSKYCSDECGIQYMKIKIAEFEKGGGDRKKLWETVKHAEKREGVVVCVEDGVKMDEEGACKNDMRNVTRTTKARVQWDVERLNGQLDQVVQEREKLKKELDLVLWRTRLLDFATERSEKVDECAWDQRLCFGYEEYADFGMEALTTYEAKDTEEGEDAMRVDSAGAEEGEWWCRGKKKCERHFGWQKLRAAEVSFEKEMKEAVLLKLTTREREIRKRIEDLLDPQARTMPSSTPVKPTNGKLQVNGRAKTNPNGEGGRKGKKKKA